ncbi:GNAT family N-acetyltransferase [Luteipulveratus halotolerans]|uniref:N-acetyltransferase domain-containing protein n=1 Tax=Luteipulveratus halotolerans TaxID=1631356 RepID=A0A0L6CP02_9MICO|nr:GNAT family N-acetyltransferase [Luteipulveratus halotolerans]KNX39452.1 hypothetical protein VV01_13120 [Luteipulveratus halotolerans]
MIRLIAPTTDLHTSWLEAVDEFDGGQPHGFGFSYGILPWSRESLSTPEGFADFVETRNQWSVPGSPMPDGLVNDSIFWIVDDTEPDRVLGSLSLRHELNDFLLNAGGHIGYGVRPSARGRGVATAALIAALDEARALGLDRVLVSCDADNEASRRTIVRGGGVLEDTREGIERYWIDLT